MKLDGHTVGVIGELHPVWVQRYDLGTAPVVFELALDAALAEGVKRIIIDSPASIWINVRGRVEQVTNCSVVRVDNGFFRLNQPLDITDITPTPVLIAALGPKMLRLAGERTDGTILWLADERAIGDHIAPAINAAAEAAGRARPRIVAGVPVCLCGPDEVDVAVARANRVLSEAEISPNYQKLLDHGDARSIGDILAAGTEEMIERRLRSFADAGVTDVSVRVVPIGNDRDELIASSKRTRAYLASLRGQLA